MSPRIDRCTPVPLYFQIAERLRNQMQTQGMHPGELLTTDERVQQEFGVSRATARKAIDELVDEGLVERITGKGTFICEPHLQVPLPSMLGFTTELKHRGMHPSTRVVSVGWAPVGKGIGDVLGLDADTLVLRLERIRYADDKPVLHSVDILPEQLRIKAEDDFSGSLYGLIESRGVELAGCQNVIEASVADQRLGGLLEVKKGFPILVLRRTSYDSSGRPVLYEDAYFRGDMYSYAIRLFRPSRDRWRSGGLAP